MQHLSTVPIIPVTLDSLLGYHRPVLGMSSRRHLDLTRTPDI